MVLPQGLSVRNCEKGDANALAVGVHSTFHIHTHGTGTFVQDCKLGAVDKQPTSNSQNKYKLKCFFFFEVDGVNINKNDMNT